MLPQHDKEMDLLMVLRELFRDLKFVTCLPLKSKLWLHAGSW